jgi:hypothetical protein
MKRREFIQGTMGLACLLLNLDPTSPQKHGVRLLSAAERDLAGKESECGFARALNSLLPTHPPVGRTFIVPSASAMQGTALSSLVREAQQGASVLIDLADGFASRSDTARTRAHVERYLGVEVADPVAYTSAEYVVFRWPLSVMVRHFIRVSFIAPARNMPIAHLGTHSIAVRKEVGLGSVLIIGSNLGPLLLAGDEQAHQVFARLLTTNEEVSCSSPRVGDPFSRGRA